MRRGVALVMVLFFIIVILGIIGAIFKFYSKIETDNSIVENSLIIKEVENSLKIVQKDINSSNDLKNLFIDFPISSNSGKTVLKIKIEPLSNRVNLNEYLSNNRINPYIDRFLDNILEFYRVGDPIFFKDLLLDTLDKNDLEREGFSEIKLEDRSFLNGKIYSFRHFEKILSYYVKHRDDKSILKIPWKRYIYFYKSKMMIECNLLDEKLAKFLGLEFDNLNCKSLENFEINKKIMDNLDIMPYSKGRGFLLKIKANTLYMVYDLKKKRVVDIENNISY